MISSCFDFVSHLKIAVENYIITNSGQATLNADQLTKQFLDVQMASFFSVMPPYQIQSK